MDDYNRAVDYARRYMILRLAARGVIDSAHDPKTHAERIKRLSAAMDATQEAHLPAFLKRDAIDTLLSWLVTERSAALRALGIEEENP